MDLVWYIGKGYYSQWSVQFGNGYFQLDLGRLQIRAGDVNAKVGKGYHFWYFAPWRWSWVLKLFGRNYEI